MSNKPIEIVVVDDHVFMRELISRTLSRQTSQYEVVAEAGSASEALAACRELKPDLIILDINLPDRSGLATIPDLRRASPNTRILLCTAFAAEDRLHDAMTAGADGFVEKTHTWNAFLDAVERVSNGERYFHSTCTPKSPRSDDTTPSGRSSKPGLSPREHEILKLIAEGSTSKEIAHQLHISVQTVDTHRANLMTKLAVRNVAGLVLYAVRNGLIELPAGDRSATAQAQ